MVLMNLARQIPSSYDNMAVFDFDIVDPFKLQVNILSYIQ